MSGSERISPNGSYSFVRNDGYSLPDEESRTLHKDKQLSSAVKKVMADLGIPESQCEWGTTIVEQSLRIDPKTNTPIRSSLGQNTYAWGNIPTGGRYGVLRSSMRVRTRGVPGSGYFWILHLLPGQKYGTLYDQKIDGDSMFLVLDPKDPLLALKISEGKIDPDGKASPDSLDIRGFDRSSIFSRKVPIQNQFLAIDTMVALTKERKWKNITIKPDSAYKFKVIYYYKLKEAGYKDEQISGFLPTETSYKNYMDWCTENELAHSNQELKKFMNSGKKGKKKEKNKKRKESSEFEEQQKEEVPFGRVRMSKLKKLLNPFKR